MVTPRKIIENKKKFAAIACILAVVAVVCLHGAGGSSATQFLKGQAWGNTLIALFAGFSSLALAELVWRIILVLRYKPIAGVSDDQLPTCTIVVPAYNEGRQVFDTLKCLAASNYPREKIQLIAVDDGSVDDTWEWIKNAKKTLALPVLTIRQPLNQGKRQALYDGFKKSTGTVLVTVDSDSMVEPDTLRNLVTPFSVNPIIGAVAGNVRVLNQAQGIIPRMLDIVFVFSFDFMRASQSMFRTVTCTPWALSAYRKSAVIGVLDKWLNQTFLGRRANIGEDRAMTNMILRQGYDVVFQRNARVFTEVPVAYAQLCKMYLRWARSNVREGHYCHDVLYLYAVSPGINAWGADQPGFRRAQAYRGPDFFLDFLGIDSVAPGHIREQDHYRHCAGFQPVRHHLRLEIRQGILNTGICLWIFLFHRPDLDQTLCLDYPSPLPLAYTGLSKG